eukprot:1328087-Amphidinium_carterae.1
MAMYEALRCTGAELSLSKIQPVSQMLIPGQCTFLQMHSTTKSRVWFRVCSHKHTSPETSAGEVSLLPKCVSPSESRGRRQAGRFWPCIAMRQ